MVPGQIKAWLAEMVTSATSAEDTVILIVSEVAGLLVAHDELEVTAQEIASPFAGISDQAGLFPPTEAPFRNHWNEGEEPSFMGVAV